MLIALLALGAALVVFGGVVLLRYADREGGSVKWLGLEVTSKSAGLPLIALGVACVATAATRWPASQRVDPRPDRGRGQDTTHALASTPADSGACATTAFPQVAADRIATMELGMPPVRVAEPPQPLDSPVGVVLTDHGTRVASLRLRLHRGRDASADLYRIEAAVDGGCAPLSGMSNASRGGDPTAIVNWDTFHFQSGGRGYDLRIGGEGTISVSEFHLASR